MRETTRKTTILSLAVVLAGGMLAGCLSETDAVQAPEVAEVGDVDAVGSELGAAGGGSDAWRFPNQRGDRHNRNFCPLVAAIASPSSVKVGQRITVQGFAYDFDRRPQSLKYKWTASPATSGTFDSATSKGTRFLCKTAGSAKLTFSATDGDCTRSFSMNVYCKPAQAPTCGNGVVEGTETCDGNCPTSCDDDVACTTDTRTGSASQCNVVCSNAPITACAGGDMCCAPGCNNANDSDCTPTGPVCGNGVTEPGETCDGDCPASCDDNIACTTDIRTGTPASCNVLCEHSAVTSCSLTADSCCPTGCTASTDADCSPSCGNNVIEAGETCDGNCPTSCNDNVACTTDTLTGGAATCDAVCTNTAITACTNDDGCCAPGCNNTNDDDCAPPEPDCGNGLLDSGETCDDSSSTPCPTSCDDGSACTANVPSGSAATCDFKCDFPAITTCSATGDSCCPSGCNSTNDFDCVAVCGNGVKEGSEICDGDCPASCDDGDACTTDGSTGSAASCDLVCTHSEITTPECLCGNGRIDAGEACDGNCPTTCEDSNPCTQDVLTGAANTCNAVCTHTPIDSPECNCGNGELDNGETCDNTSSTACPTSCTPSTDACVNVQLTGSPDTCNVACTSTDRACGTAGDQCCPSGCTPAQDGDCMGDACETCHANPDNFLCAETLAACDALPGVTAETNPFRPNMPKNQLCREIVNCMEEQHCAQNAATDCLCGLGVNPNTCFAGTFEQMTGPCREVIAAGAESVSVTDLAVRFSLEDFALGAATSVIEKCDQLFCAAECL